MIYRMHHISASDYKLYLAILWYYFKDNCCTINFSSYMPEEGMCVWESCTKWVSMCCLTMTTSFTRVWQLTGASVAPSMYITRVKVNNITHIQVFKKPIWNSLFLNKWKLFFISVRPHYNPDLTKLKSNISTIASVSFIWSKTDPWW